MTESSPRRQVRLYHDWLLPEEARAVRSDVRSFVSERVLPVADSLNTTPESTQAFPWGLFRAMAGLGLFALPFSRDEGGRGLDYPLCAAAVAVEELAYASDGLAAIYDDHCILPGVALMHGSADLRERYLRPLIDGSRVACMAITEPQAGSDLSVETVATTARQDAGGYVLSGHKRFITNAPVGDFAATLCVVGGRLSMLVVDLHAPGVRVGPPDLKTGNHAQLTADVWFDDVRVPLQNLVGDEGQGLHVALGALTWGRVVIGAAGVGMAQAAFDECTRYMEDRRMFGGRLADMQHWQFRLAEHAMHIGMARDLCYKAALRYDLGERPPEPETAMAKYYGTQVAVDVARDAVQVVGGLGFITRLGADGSACRVEQIYRDCKVGEIYEGANEVQKRVIARQAFGRMP